MKPSPDLSNQRSAIRPAAGTATESAVYVDASGRAPCAVLTGAPHQFFRPWSRRHHTGEKIRREKMMDMVAVTIYTTGPACVQCKMP